MDASRLHEAPTTRAGRAARLTLVGAGSCAGALLLGFFAFLGAMLLPGGHEGRFAWIGLSAFTLLMAAATVLSCRGFGRRTTSGRAARLGSAAGFLTATAAGGFYALLAWAMAQPH